MSFHCSSARTWKSKQLIVCTVSFIWSFLNQTKLLWHFKVIFSVLLFCDVFSGWNFLAQLSPLLSGVLKHFKSELLDCIILHEQLHENTLLSSTALKVQFLSVWHWQGILLDVLVTSFFAGVNFVICEKSHRKKDEESTDLRPVCVVRKTVLIILWVCNHSQL